MFRVEDKKSLNERNPGSEPRQATTSSRVVEDGKKNPIVCTTRVTITSRAPAASKPQKRRATH
jgi:hypothetical protein